jgi:hypothetical protein
MLMFVLSLVALEPVGDGAGEVEPEEDSGEEVKEGMLTVDE